MSGPDPEGKTRRVRPAYMPAPEETTLPVRRRVLAAQGRQEAAQTTAETAMAVPADILHLAEAVAVLRERLDVPSAFSDDAILASLRMIAARGSQRERTQAAFNSNLARYLFVRGRDSAVVLREIVAILPVLRA